MNKVINPYSFIGSRSKEALDFIITNLPASPTFDQLNEVLVTALYTPDTTFPSINTLATTVLGTVLPSMYNGYVNAGAKEEGRGTKGNTNYNEKQQVIITKLMDGLARLQPEVMGDLLDSTEESIVTTGMTFDEQLPLLVTTAAARAHLDYWLAAMETPGPWSIYLSDEKLFNYLHIRGLVSAAAQGSLLAYGLARPPQIQFLDFFTSLIGSVGLVSGKLVLGWEQVG